VTGANPAPRGRAARAIPGKRRGIEHEKLGRLVAQAPVGTVAQGKAVKTEAAKLLGISRFQVLGQIEKLGPKATDEEA
jgi:hypothetical protein